MYQICKFCGNKFLFKNKVSMGGHVASCEKNPNIKNTREKQKASNTKPPISLTLCCKLCGVEFTQTVKKHIFANNKHKKYCSRKCANTRNHSEKTKQLIKSSVLVSDKFKNRQHRQPTPKLDIICKNPSCKKEFFAERWKKRKYCSLKCAAHKNGGQRLYSGRSRYHGGWYNNIWMDSSWELMFAKKLDEDNIEWTRDNSKYFEYSDLGGKCKKYYPDFYIPEKDLYVEIKGYWTPAIRHKIEQVRKNHNINLTVLESVEEIKTFKL
jgi:hypothetical protein